MRIKLPDLGEEVELRIHHKTFERHIPQGTWPVVNRRGTLVILKKPDGAVPGELLGQVQAVVHPKDNFCRREGRRICARKLNALLAWRLSKRDRAHLINWICPEFAVPEKFLKSAEQLKKDKAERHRRREERQQKQHSSS